MNHIALITAGLSLAACVSNQPTQDEYDDTAQAIATTAAMTGSGNGGDVASMADTVSLSLGVAPQGISLAGNGQFQGSRLGIDYQYSLSCETAGVAGACGPATDQATATVAWSGDLSSTYVDASVSRNGSWTVTGLQSSTATFAGDSTFSFDATLRSIFRPGAMATYSFDASARYSAVKIAMADRTVIGGSASYDLTAHHEVTGPDGSASGSFDVHAVLTFQADHTATLVLDGSRSYSLDLDTGVIVHAP